MQALDKEQKDAWLKHNQAMADDGLRLIALATKETESSDADPYTDLTLLALLGVVDPPRAEVKDSINACKDAGIHIVMVTGDHLGTARNVGRSVGLIGQSGEDNGGSEVPRGQEIEGASDETVLNTRIFARITPEQKLDLIDRYQKKGEIVAMTGDGVNDAPALQKADIGVAMGQRGTEVAQEVADMILQDDAFASIVVASEYGRIIFENIRKFSVYQLSGNVGEIVAVAIATVINLPLPLLPLQILYLNVLNDIFPSLALGIGGHQPGIMDRPPRDPKTPVLGRGHWAAIVAYGLLIGVVALVSLWLALNWLGLAQNTAITISFLTVAFSRLWHVFNMRSQGSALLRNEVTRNPFVWGALVLCIVLLLVSLYVPALANVLKLQNLGLQGWMLILGMSLIPLILGQIAKFTRIIFGLSTPAANPIMKHRVRK